MFVQETVLSVCTRDSVECLFKRKCSMFVQETVLNVCTKSDKHKTINDSCPHWSFSKLDILAYTALSISCIIFI